MNKMKEVAKVLGYEVGEEFNIIYNTGSYSMYNPFKFTETDLVNNNGDILNGYITTLITGEYKIEKIPFVPKVGEYYWTYVCCGEQVHVVQHRLLNNCFDKERKLLGVIFRTKQEAKDYLPTWQKGLEGEEV